MALQHRAAAAIRTLAASSKVGPVGTCIRKKINFFEIRLEFCLTCAVLTALDSDGVEAQQLSTNTNGIGASVEGIDDNAFCIYSTSCVDSTSCIDSTFSTSWVYSTSCQDCQIKEFHLCTVYSN